MDSKTKPTPFMEIACWCTITSELNVDDFTVWCHGVFPMNKAGMHKGIEWLSSACIPPGDKACLASWEKSVRSTISTLIGSEHLPHYGTVEWISRASSTTVLMENFVSICRIDPGDSKLAMGLEDMSYFRLRYAC